ncbi:MAG TPA: cob(I)yrinic acid a,c-diamide adenosyltransferase [Thermoanaerobaculia bacterium]|jgi:hypothetical protein
MSDQEPPRMQPYGRQVLICTGGYCAAPEAAMEIDRRLAELSRAHGRRTAGNPERIKCTPTGCLGVCQGGPILVVYPEGTWYHHVGEEGQWRAAELAAPPQGSSPPTMADEEVRAAEFYYGWLDAGEVIAWLAAHKPPQMHLVITGRYAPPALVEFADLVTEMREVKHPFRDQGIRAQPGVEY